MGEKKRIRVLTFFSGKLVDASVGGTTMQNIDFGRLRDLANEREFDYMATSFKQSQM